MGSRTLTAAILMVSAVTAVPAQAAAVGQFLSATVLFAAPTAMPAACTAFSSADAPQSKAEALLGGAPSALSRITSAQQAAVQPAAFVQTSFACAVTRTSDANQGVVRTFPAQVDGSGDDFLSSTRLAVSRTPFDREWTRVSAVALRAGAMRPLHLSPGHAATLVLLHQVNAWANEHIRYEDDQALYGRPDYWASAPQTLKRRAGDCEDIAILKYQLLAAAGIPRDTMFLTVARDLVRHADHAVLVAAGALGGCATGPRFPGSRDRRMDLRRNFTSILAEAAYFLRATQRKPMCPVEVSVVSAWRAAGR